MAIKSLSEMERPLEKAAVHGIGSLSNVELLGVIIHSGTRDSSALHLAEELLSGCPHGISDLGSMTLEELEVPRGIGPAKACRILAAVDLGKRIAAAAPVRRPVVRCAEDVAAIFMERLRYEKKEHFFSVLLNVRGEVIEADPVSVGELTSTVVHPREVFRQAVRRSAAAVIFVHNHPSGDPTPSNMDYRTTQRLIECGELLGIEVHDHIVIGDGKYESLRGHFPVK